MQDKSITKPNNKNCHIYLTDALIQEALDFLKWEASDDNYYFH